MIVVDNNESSFDELLGKADSEIEKSYGAITKSFKKVCKGKNKKKFQKTFEKAFKKKISQIVTLIGGKFSYTNLYLIIL